MDYSSHPVPVVSTTFAVLEHLFTGAVASIICEKLTFLSEGVCRHCGLHFSRYQGFADDHFGVWFCSPVCSERDRKNRKRDFWSGDTLRLWSNSTGVYCFR